MSAAGRLPSDVHEVCSAHAAYCIAHLSAANAALVKGHITTETRD
jgi:hypothetical protein